jgi:hypothetical protein
MHVTKPCRPRSARILDPARGGKGGQRIQLSGAAGSAVDSPLRFHVKVMQTSNVFRSGATSDSRTCRTVLVTPTATVTRTRRRSLSRTKPPAPEGPTGWLHASSQKWERLMSEAANGLEGFSPRRRIATLARLSAAGLVGPLLGDGRTQQFPASAEEPGPSPGRSRSLRKTACLCQVRGSADARTALHQPSPPLSTQCE